MQQLIYNIGQLITLAPLVRERRYTKITTKDLGIVHDAWLSIEKGKVAAFGQGSPPADLVSDGGGYDAGKGLVLPGLVDCHTHPIFGGDRADEFVRRLKGETYKEIADKGGGIQRTVSLTRAASDTELSQVLRANLKTFLKQGVTTVEVKSGYGLCVAEELRLLRLIKEAAATTPQHLSATALALHALPIEKNGPNKPEFLRQMIEELLPVLKTESLADWVDAFVEDGYFTVDEARSFCQAAQKLGLGVRLHADEFTNQKAGLLAADLGAASCDHLECTDQDSIRAMAAQGVVAVLLPGTSLYTRIPFTDAGPFLAAECPIALATDFNPGSCQVKNLTFIATLGALHCGLDLPHTLAAITLVPARSLRLENRKGALAVGMDADFNLYDYGSIDQWLADLGQRAPLKTAIGGRWLS